MKSIEDIDKNRLNLLRADRGLTPVYEAVMWLRENKNKFRAPIHEPPLISVRLHQHFLKIRFETRFIPVFVAVERKRHQNGEIRRKQYWFS